MERGRVWEFNPKKMCKTEREFWTKVFDEHAPLNLQTICYHTGLTPTLISKKITGKAHLTVPQMEELKIFFDGLLPEWRKR